MTWHASVEFCKFARSFDLKIHVDFSWCHARFSSGFPRLRSLISFSKTWEWWMNKKWSGFDVNHMTNKFLRCARTKIKAQLRNFTHANIFSDLFPAVIRIWCDPRGEKTDSRGTQLLASNGRNRSRLGPACSTKYAGNAVGRWVGSKSSAMGKWMHVSTWPEPVLRWVRVRCYRWSLRQRVRGSANFFGGHSTKIKHFLSSFILSSLNNDEPNWMEIEHKWEK